jgi:hypothetical protein
MRGFIRRCFDVIPGFQLMTCDSAHRAADPSKYPVRDEQREMYPPLKGIEERYGPSKVHLQVYDGPYHH